jgi:GR25 family glycosyltransferase involved in LPS biosynthesis
MIKIIQLCSDPTEKREIESFKSLSKLGYRYVRMISPKWITQPPLDSIIDGNRHWYVGITKPDITKFGLTAGHYGCWHGHHSCVLSSFSDDDYTIITEADCLLNVNAVEFDKYVKEAIHAMEENPQYKMVRFESWSNIKSGKKITDNIFETNSMIQTHCYMIHKKDEKWWRYIFNNFGWHAYDLWLNIVFDRTGEKMLFFPTKHITTQADGPSAIDRE